MEGRHSTTPFPQPWGALCVDPPLSYSRAPSTGPGSTSSSLLRRVGQGDPDAWRRLVRLYGPLVYIWARQCGLQPADAADVHQETFVAVAGSVGDFRRERPDDSFRGWLWTITRNKICDHFRRRRGQAAAQGGTDAQEQLLQVPEPPKPSADSQADAGSQIARRAMELIRGEFEDRTWQAFWRTAVDGLKAAEVADELGMTLAAVYQAKYRVLRRIRQELGELGIAE
jgi:RNA polymerase sigma-70 factor (ECF subfamily)